MTHIIERFARAVVWHIAQTADAYVQCMACDMDGFVLEWSRAGGHLSGPHLRTCPTCDSRRVVLSPVCWLGRRQASARADA